MPLFKDKLQNDNVFIWFGTNDEDLVNNALILSGGEAFILMGIQKIDLFKPKIREDLLIMSVRDFIDKYDLINLELINNIINEREIKEEKYKSKVFELIKELKKGVRSGVYPHFMGDNKIKLKGFKNKINDYLIKMTDSLQSEETISYLEDIIEICEEKIQITQKRDIKNKERFEKLKRMSESPRFNKLIKIQRELDENIKHIGNKIHTTLKLFEDLKRSLR